MKIFGILSIITLCIVAVCFALINAQPVYAGRDCDDFSEGSEINFPAGEDFINNPPPELFECNSNDDCSIVGDPCGWPTSVNKDFASCYSRVAQWAGASLDCVMYRGEEKTAVCAESLCQAK